MTENNLIIPLRLEFKGFLKRIDILLEHNNSCGNIEFMN